MTNIEVAAPYVDFPLDRDAVRYRKDLLGLADMVILGERSDHPHDLDDETRNRREYVYLMIDSAAERGLVIDNLEAIELMAYARQLREANEARVAEKQHGPWDVNDGIN